MNRNLYHRARYLHVTLSGIGAVTLLMWPGTVAWQSCAVLLVIGAAALARMQ